MKPSPLARHLRAGASALFLLVLLAAPFQAGIPDLYSQAMLGCLILLAGATALAARRLAGATERLATPVDWPILLLVAATAASVVGSVNRHASVVELLRLLSQVTAFYLAASLTSNRPPAGDPEPEKPAPAKARRGRPKEHARSPVRPVSRAPVELLAPALLWAVLAAGAAWAGGRGVVEYAAALRQGWGSYRVFGGFLNPNVLAGHLALTMPLLAAATLVLRARADRWRAGWPVPAILLLLSLGGAAFTGSRLGLVVVSLGLGLFALVTLARQRRLSRAQLAALAVGLVVLGGIVVLLVPTLRLRFLGIFREGFSLGFRVTTWMAAARIFLAHPLLGTGAGSFSSIMTRYSETGFTQAAHNHFLQTAAETGLFGILGLVALLVGWAGAVRRGLAEATPTRAALLAAALAGVAASSAHALLDVDWSIPATGWALWAILGGALGAAGAVKRVPARPAGEGLLLAVLLLVLLPGWRIGMAAGHAEDAAYLAAEDPVAAEAAFREALRLDPYSPDTHREFGRFLGGLGLAHGEERLLAEGRVHLHQAIRLSPTNGLNAYHLGILEMRSGRTRAADEAFRRSLECDPHNPYTLRRLGQLHERANPAETLRIARRLVAVEQSLYGRLRPIAERVDPDYAFGHYWLAQAYRRAGRQSEAAAALRRAARRLQEHRASLQGQGGIDVRGEQRQEPDADVQALEAAVQRALAELSGPADAAP